MNLKQSISIELIKNNKESIIINKFKYIIYKLED